MEFALVLPLIFIIFIGTVEFSRLFRMKEMLALASRAAAHEAFRECYETRRTMCAGTDTRIDACLTQYVTIVAGAMQNRMQDLELTISMYSWDPVSSSADLIGITLKRGVIEGDIRTEFDVATVQSNFGDMLERQRVIVIGEAYYQFPFLFDTNILPAFRLELYDVTVF